MARKLSLVLVLMLLVAACARPAPDTAPKSAAPTGPTPMVGGELALRLARDPDNFNPLLTFTAYGSAIVSQVYATLFEFNEKWEPTPYVAESWTPSSDGLTWTIKIKDGVKFHDGTDLTADDVAFTINATLDPAYRGPRKASASAIRRVSAPDRSTVVVELNHPFAPLLEQINYGILPRRLFQNVPVGEWERHEQTIGRPIGAGPYRFVEYRRGQYVLLERNPAWFMSAARRGAPFVQTLRYRIIPENAAALAELEAGRLDWDTPDPKEVDRLKQVAGLASYEYQRNGWGYIIINTTRPHLSDPLVRQALTLGLDRQAVITGVLGGRAVVPPGPIPPVSWAYDPAMKAPGFDPAMAKQLLERAGYKLGRTGIYEKNGQPLRLTFHASAGTLAESIAAIAQRNWKAIGVQLDVQLMEFNAMMETVLRPGRFDLSFAGFGLGFDPDLYPLFHSSQGAPDARTPVAGANLMRYRNARVDELLEAGRRETDRTRRQAIYAEVQKLLVDDAPVIFLYTNTYTDFVSRKVKGGVVNLPGSGPSFLSGWWINELP